MTVANSRPLPGIWSFTLTLFVCIVTLCQPDTVSGRLSNILTPSCGPDEQKCVFYFNVTKQETMVWYNRTLNKGYPVVDVNGTFYRRLPENCTELEEMSTEELLDVATADGRSRVAYFINDQMPGPSMVVYEGQQVVVHVYNQLIGEGLSIHWHGMVQHNTPWMDGVGSVTQCNINSEERFTYRFLASPAGTHWYHSHTGTQRTDGLYGALIVLPKPRPGPNDTPKDNETAERKKRTVNKALQLSREDVHISPTKMFKMHQDRDSQVDASFTHDFLMMVGDWYAEDSGIVLTRYLKELQRFTPGYDNLEMCHDKTQQTDGAEVGTLPFESALINGRGRVYLGRGNDSVSFEALTDTPREVYKVKQDAYYRFRVINPSLNFAFKILIDNHKLTVTSSDGNPLQPVEVDALIINAGERYDFYIHADQSPDNYWIRAYTTERYNGKDYDWDHPIRQERPGIARAILHYDGATEDDPTSKLISCTDEKRCLVLNCPFVAYPDREHSDCINYDKLKNHYTYSLPPVVPSQFEEHFLDFHFPRDGVDILRSMVNGRQFLLPSTPPQVLGYAKYDSPCTEACDEGESCKCTYQVNLTRGNMVQMTLISHVTPISWAGIPASAHPVHMHGHHFYVMKVGYPIVDPVTKRYVAVNPDIHCPTDRCHNATWSQPYWAGGKVPGLNEVDPPLKDTVTVPAGGYVVIRFMADNPGWWLMHCHLELHQVEGMTLILQEGTPSDMNPPPPGFPTCGSFDWSSDDFWDKVQHPDPHPVTTTTTAPSSAAQNCLSLLSLITLYLAL